MVSSISGSLPAAVPRREPVHFHCYLTPVLHRRFARVCAITIIACYVESFLIGNKTNSWVHYLQMCNVTNSSIVLWACFPLSWTGARCLFLFLLGSLPVLVLRISQLHCSYIFDLFLENCTDDGSGHTCLYIGISRHSETIWIIFYVHYHICVCRI